MDIADYNCYREYLADAFKKIQNENSNFSYQYVANRLNTGKTYIKLVIEKKRHISLDKVPPICKLFKLKDWEFNFFLILFLKNTTNDQELTNFFEKALGRIDGKNLGEVKSIKVEEDRRISYSWLPMAILSMSKMKGFKPEATWIQKYLNDKSISEQEIQIHLDTILENNMIVQENGKWKPSSFIYNQDDDFMSDETNIYSIGLSRIKSSLQNFTNYTPRSNHVMTIGIKKEDRREVIRLYNEFMTKLMTLSKNTSESDLVMFASNNVITLASNIEDEDKE